MGLGLVAAMRLAGREIVWDFGLLTYGGSILHDFLSPPTSAFYYSNYLIGEHPASLLERAMAGEKLAELKTIVTADFVDHGSQRMQPVA